jgi:hypothetical protein
MLLKFHQYYLFERVSTSNIPDDIAQELDVLAKKRPIWYAWLCANYDDNLNKLSDAFNAFVRYRSQLPVSNREIRSYVNLDALCEVLDKYFGYDKMKLDKNAGFIYDDSVFIAYSPRTFEASCKYGSGEYCDQREKDMYYYYHKHSKSAMINIIRKYKQFEYGVHINSVGDVDFWETDGRYTVSGDIEEELVDNFGVSQELASKVVEVLFDSEPDSPRNKPASEYVEIPIWDRDYGL